MKTTPEQAVKIGFLLKCAQEGLTLEETHERVKQAILILKAKQLTKEAVDPLGLAMSTLGFGKDVAKEIVFPGIQTLGTLGGAAAIGGPIVGGALGGYGLAKLTGGDNSASLDDIKQKEVVNEYERLADEAKRRALIKKIQSRTGRRIVPLMPSLRD